MKKVLSIIIALSLVIGVFSVQTVTNVLAETSYDVLSNISYFKVSGRNISKNHLDHAGASLEWNANCSGDVKVVVSGGASYFTAYVDGVRVNTRFQVTNSNSTTLTIATGLPSGNHNFKLAKQTQQSDGRNDVKSVIMSGSFNSAPSNKSAYIEIIGDSISAGLGNITTANIKPADSDATQSYGYLTADALNADLSIVAQGGIGITSGYSGPARMCELYPYTSYFRNNSTKFTATRTPNVVVINLGTNDIGVISSKSDTSYTDINGNKIEAGSVAAARAGMVERLKAHGKQLIDQVIANYGRSVPIVFCYGMMSAGTTTFKDSNNSTMPKIISALQSSYSNLYSCELVRNTAGGGGHPNLTGHSESANILVNFIKSKGWISGGSGTVTTAGTQATQSTTTTTTTTSTTQGGVTPTQPQYTGDYPAVPSYNGQAYSVGNIINKFDSTISFEEQKGTDYEWTASNGSGTNAFSGQSLKVFTKRKNYDVNAFTKSTVSAQSNYKTTSAIVQELASANGFRIWYKGEANAFIFFTTNGSNSAFVTLTASPNGEWKTVYFDKGAYSSDGSTAVNFVGSFTWANIGSCDGIKIRASQNKECYFDEFHTIYKGTAPIVQTTSPSTSGNTPVNPTVTEAPTQPQGSENYPAVPSYNGQQYSVKNIINKFDSTISFEEQKGTDYEWTASNGSGTNAFSGQSLKVFTKRKNYDVNVFTKSTVSAQSNYKTTSAIVQELASANGFRIWYKGEANAFIFFTVNGANSAFVTLTASPNGEWKTVYFDKGAYSSDGSTAVNFVGSFTWANIGSCDGIKIRASQNKECYFDEFHTIRKGAAPVVPTQTTTQGSGLTKGDMDGNNTLNILDVQQLLTLVKSGQTGDKRITDMDNNGNVDILDIQILLTTIL